MRILFLNPVGEIGGAERVMLDVAASLRHLDSSLELGLICFGDGPLRDAATRSGMEVMVLELPEGLSRLGDSGMLDPGVARSERLRSAVGALTRAGSVVPFAQRLRSSIRRWRPDLLHSNGIKAHLLSALVRPAAVPLVWHVHDYLSQRPAIRRLLALLSSRATAAVAISESVRSDALGVLGALPVHTVLNAVDLARFSPGPGESEWLDKLAGWPRQGEVVRVGLVATYGRWKGHELFLDAAERLSRAQHLPPTRFYIVGGPIYRTVGSQYSLNELRTAAHHRGISELVGFVPYQHETERVYRSLDVLVHSSIRPEPFGLTIAEAMACGRSTVVALAGGAAELFEDGVSALSYPSGDAQTLAERLEQLVRSPSHRARLGRAAHEHANRHFSRERLGKCLLPLYQSVQPGGA